LQDRHPWALGRFDALAAAAKGKQIAVFLDYDGTLSPIVEDPDSAVMTDEVREPPFFSTFPSPARRRPKAECALTSSYSK
jgi:hypothetical protein